METEEIINSTIGNYVVVELVEIGKDGKPVVPKKSHGFAVKDLKSKAMKYFENLSSALAYAKEKSENTEEIQKSRSDGSRPK